MSAKAVADRAWRFETEETPEREVYLLLQHVAGELIHGLAAVLKPSGVTPEQYHVLRTLNDAGAAGIAASDVGRRSPRGDPDVTRLLDRLERSGLASRSRESADRRVVIARITADGKALLRKVAGPVAELHSRQLAPIDAPGREELRRLLWLIAAQASR